MVALTPCSVMVHWLLGKTTLLTIGQLPRLTCEIFTRSFDTVPSFADRDMFIRYMGLGVGQYRPPT